MICTAARIDFDAIESTVNSFQKDLDQNPLDLVEGDIVEGGVVELGRAGRFMCCDSLGMF